MDYAGLVAVAAIWAAIIWVLCRMLGMNDDDNERDPY